MLIVLVILRVGNYLSPPNNPEFFFEKKQSPLNRSNVPAQASRSLDSLALPNEPFLNSMNQGSEVDFNALDPVQQLVRIKELDAVWISKQVSRIKEKQNKWEKYYQWVDSRKELIDNYPFEPTYHPTLRYSKAFLVIERPGYNVSNKLSTESNDDYNKYLKESRAEYNAKYARKYKVNKNMQNHSNYAMLHCG